MPQFKVTIRWATECKGFWNVEAESEAEARAKADENIEEIWTYEMYGEEEVDVVIGPTVEGAEVVKEDE